LCLAPSAKLDKTKLNSESVNGSSQRNNKKIQKLLINIPEGRQRERGEKERDAVDSRLGPRAEIAREIRTCIRRDDKSMQHDCERDKVTRMCSQREKKGRKEKKDEERAAPLRSLRMRVRAC